MTMAAATTYAEYRQVDEAFGQLQAQSTFAELSGVTKRSAKRGQQRGEQPTATVLGRFVDTESQVVVASGLLAEYVSRVTRRPVIQYSLERRPDQEFEVYLKMPAKATRNGTVKIIGRVRATPNPIL